LADSTQKTRKDNIVKQAVPLLSVILLSYIGFSLALPIFPPLLLNISQDMLDPSTLKSTRSLLLGLLLSMYPVGQLFGCPLLGKFSDRFGRKIVLLISLISIVPSFCLTAFSLQIKHLPLLFFSRFLCGFLEGNVVIAQAAISDLSQNHREKTKFFGYILSLTSAGFIIGPLLGGKLTDNDLVSWFDNSVPFWSAAIIAAVAFILIALLFKDTKNSDPEVSIDFKSLMISYIKGIQLRHLRLVYVTNFFLYASLFFFLGFFPAYLVDFFGFNAKTLGYAESYLALTIFLTSLFFGLLAKLFLPNTIMKSVGFIFCVSLIIFLIPASPNALVLTLPPLGISCAVSFTYTAIMISDRADAHVQGEALGLNQSVQVFAEALTGLLGGLLAGIFIKLPLIFGALFALVAAFFFITVSKKQLNV
jgi:DHA1 family tetracycline resistance protein-like MFS transporter